MRIVVGISLVCVAALASGCATSNGKGLTSSGSSCKSLKQQINRIAAKGLPPKNKADSDAYNRLLNDYLGSRCHEAKT